MAYTEEELQQASDCIDVDTSSPRWGVCSRYDINCDGKIDVLDIILISQGKRKPIPIPILVLLILIIIIIFWLWTG